MYERIRKQFSPTAMVLSVLAIFLALTGAAFAAGGGLTGIGGTGGIQSFGSVDAASLKPTAVQSFGKSGSFAGVHGIVQSLG